MMDIFKDTYQFLFTSTVVAALIAGIVNIFLSISNKRLLRSIEIDKKMSKIEEYRYTHLYELLCNWNAYDATAQNDDHDNGEMMLFLHRSFAADERRYSLARPLLDEKYKETIDPLHVHTQSAQTETMEVEMQELQEMQDTPKSAFNGGYIQFLDSYSAFHETLIAAINQQLQELLQKDTV